MQTTVVRGFVFLVALTGMGASSISSRPSAKAGLGVHANIIPTPPPMCLPGSGDYCGMTPGQ